MKKRRLKLQTTHIIVLGFVAVILAGSLLLMLPISSQDGRITNFIDAFFTATSATCVTGLAVVETGAYWSIFGKAVILAMVQIGGLGFMSLALIVSIIAKRRITPRERLVFAQSMNLNDLSGLVRFVKFIVFGTLAIESIGAMLLSIRFIPEFGIGNGILKSIFHSVSAFCNAGFDTFGRANSVSDYASDPLVTIVIAMLVIIGGLGFFVWRDLCCRFTENKKLSPYSKVVLITSVALLIIGTVFFYIFERNNPEFAHLSDAELWMASFFQSAVMRTAGFYMFKPGVFTPESRTVSMILMFIGGASGSTAGGIKVGTFAVIIIAVMATLKGNDKFSVFKRSIAMKDVLRAIGIFSVGITVVALSGFALCLIEPAVSFGDIFFEVTCAFTTVGQTMGITPALGCISKIIIAVLMFFGRVGILTVTYSIMFKQARRDNLITYPETVFLIG